MNEPKTFKKVEGPFRVDGAAYGGFTAVGGRFAGKEFILLVNNLDDAEHLFRALGIEIESTKAKKVAVVQTKNMKRLT